MYEVQPDPSLRGVLRLLEARAGVHLPARRDGSRQGALSRVSEEEIHEVYRDQKVHVLEDRCKSCIFRSVNDGRILGLKPGRVSGMVLEAREMGGVIPCHMTIRRDDVKPAICRGYWDLPRRPEILDLAVAMDVVEFDPAPKK